MSDVPKFVNNIEVANIVVLTGTIDILTEIIIIEFRKTIKELFCSEQLDITIKRFLEIVNSESCFTTNSSADNTISETRQQQ